jgi:GNAT superfamily N-acetyltransferase
MLDFCNRDYVRYRGLISSLESPRSAFGEALQRYGVVEGRLVDRGEEACRRHSFAYYSDSPEKMSLLACVSRGKLRLEGEMADRHSVQLRAWIRQLAPVGLATTHEALKRCLSDELGVIEWSQAGQYTTTAEGFTPRMVSPVRRLSPIDRPLWQRFVERYAAEPMVSGRGSGGALVRDFEFMCMGLPFDYYVTEDGGEITGVVTLLNLLTDRCDEISVLWVAPEHRRKGLAHSLLSGATQDVLARRRQPGYFAGGNPDHLGPMLTGLGYHLNSTFWEWRFWW